jgi:hypothetical protein
MRILLSCLPVNISTATSKYLSESQFITMFTKRTTSSNMDKVCVCVCACVRVYIRMSEYIYIL